MIGVEQEDLIHSSRQHWAYLAGFTGIAKHHVQKVFGVAHAVVGIHEGHADRVVVAHRG